MSRAKGKSLTRDHDGLTERERRFVRSYLIDPCGTRAARAAGYLGVTGTNRAKDLLRRPSIMAVIERERQRQAAQFEVTHESVIGELAKLAFSNMADFTSPAYTLEEAVDHDTGEVIKYEVPTGDRVVDLSRATYAQLAALQELTSEVYLEGRGDNAREVKKTKIKLADKKGALVELAKLLGMYKDESGGEVQVVVTGGLPKLESENESDSNAASA